jgi:hypothetical protein
MPAEVGLGDNISCLVAWVCLQFGPLQTDSLTLNSRDDPKGLVISSLESSTIQQYPAKSCSILLTRRASIVIVVPNTAAETVTMPKNDGR